MRLSADASSGTSLPGRGQERNAAGAAALHQLLLRQAFQTMLGSTSGSTRGLAGDVWRSMLADALATAAAPAGAPAAATGLRRISNATAAAIAAEPTWRGR